jgi:elongation factor G
MGKFNTTQKRVIGVFGHHACGKTTLMDAILKDYAGADRIGQKYLDKEPIEKEKGATYSNHVVTVDYEDLRVNFIDTPGSAEFLGDIEIALHSVDNVLIVVNAHAGVEVSTERIWNVAREMNKPVLFFINQVDKEGSNFGNVVSQLKEKFEDGLKIVPFQVPIGEGEKFKGIVNLLTKSSYIYEKDTSGKYTEINDVDKDAKEYFDLYHSELVEDIVEFDDELLEKYFEGGEDSLSQDDLMNDLHEAFNHDAIAPVLVGSALQNIGVDRLLTALKKFGMLVSERIFETEDGAEIKPDENGDLTGIIIKNDVDPFVGKLTYIRIVSGQLKAGDSFYIVQQESNEKASHLYIPRSDKNEELDVASPGDIILIPKLKNTFIGSTITKGKKVILKEAKFPEPMISKSISPESKNEIDKITNALQKLSESDPTFTWNFDSETGETVVSGIGSTHLEVMMERLKKNFEIKINIGEPKIAYRETIRTSTEAEYKHKKQTGGHGQYGHVKIRVEPLQRGEGYEFVDEIVGGVIPKSYIPSVDKGIQEAMKNGILAGYPVVDVKVTLYDGSHHEVDSSDIAFQIAARAAFKEALKMAKSVILEPIMQVEVFVPNEYTGDVMGEITSKRGRPMGMENYGKGNDKINAEIPLAEMMDFSPRLSSLTSGKGYFNMKFSHYNETSPDIQDKIIKESKVETE